jgi:tRNA (adenine22-N1)-methyltransferase
MKNVESMMSPRMKMIADAVDQCRCVFDTGSDHAFIPIYLIQNGICEKAVASDINRGPMDVSFKNIKKYNLIGRIAVSLCYGIENASGCDCIIIAGMGGQLIADILQRHDKIAKDADQLILQPMNAPEKLRKYLWDNGYEIKSENLCSEKHKVYNVICAGYNGVNTAYGEVDLHASKYLVSNGNPLLSKYLSTKIKRLSDMVNGGNDPGTINSELLSKLKELIE